MPAIEELNVPGPVAVLGDIHGNSELLAQMLAELAAQQVTTIVVCGDLCDRGPDTTGVLEQLIAVGARGVLGNHDVWLRDWAAGRGFDDFALSGVMGGKATLRSYGVDPDTTRVQDIGALSRNVPIHHRHFLLGLPLLLDLTVGDEKYWVSHTGVPAFAPTHPTFPTGVMEHAATKRPDELLWVSLAPGDMAEVDRTVIHGHRVRAQPADLGHVIALDTGCGTTQGGRLSAVVLPERRFVTVG
jgi:serine/threonine protein phosphatase 1